MHDQFSTRGVSLNNNFKTLAKQLINALNSVDEMKLRSSLVAVDEMMFAGSEDESNYYYDETLDMMMENEAETLLSLRVLQHTIAII